MEGEEEEEESLSRGGGRRRGGGGREREEEEGRTRWRLTNVEWSWAGGCFLIAFWHGTIEASGRVRVLVGGVVTNYVFAVYCVGQVDSVALRRERTRARCDAVEMCSFLFQHEIYMGMA